MALVLCCQLVCGAGFFFTAWRGERGVWQTVRGVRCLLIRSAALGRVPASDRLAVEVLPAPLPI